MAKLILPVRQYYGNLLQYFNSRHYSGMIDSTAFTIFSRVKHPVNYRGIKNLTPVANVIKLFIASVNRHFMVITMFMSFDNKE